MPSVIVAGLVQSGGQPLISGNPWSGHVVPQGKVRISLDRAASGSVYIGLSGGMTINSGGFTLSGNIGILDGVQVIPGGVYEIPRQAINTSGSINVYIGCDAACSGVARIYYEAY